MSTSKEMQYLSAMYYHTKRLVIFWHGLVIRLKPLIIQSGIVAVTVTAHPELLENKKNNWLLLFCFVVGALTNSAASPFKERRDS